MNTHRNMEEDSSMGLIASGGSLPVEFVRHAHEHGITKIVSAGVKDLTDPEVAARSTHYEEMKIGQLGRLIKFFRQHGISKAIMIGRVPPKLAVTDIPLDFRLLSLAIKIRDRRADGIFTAIAEELAKDGIHLQDTSKYLSHLLIPHGTITSKKPDSKQMLDIKFGLKMALAMGGLDIGQAAVVYKHAVIAIEAMEGTDECIKRAGKYSPHCVVVKTAKPKQDFRFDVPCIGPGTIESMKEAKASVIAVEAEKTFIIDREKAIQEANKAGIIIIGVKRDEADA